MHNAPLMSEHTAQLRVMQPAYAAWVMKDTPRQARRRRNLELLIDELGSAVALAMLTGTPKSHLSAIQAKRRGIGDELAAKLERKTGKPAGWMDVERATATASGSGAAPAPPQDPPDDFHDRRTMTDSDWTMLEELRWLPPEEVDKLRERARHQREITLAQIERLKAEGKLPK